MTPFLPAGLFTWFDEAFCLRLTAALLHNAQPRLRLTNIGRLVTWLLLAIASLVLSLAMHKPANAQSSSDLAGEAPPPTSESPAQTGSLTGRFLFDGVPPEPKRITAPSRVDYEGNLVKGEADDLLEKYKVVDESLIVGKDHGIKNVLIWVRSPEIPVPPADKLEPVTITFKEGRYEPHALAFRAPRNVVFKNEDADHPFNAKYNGVLGPAFNPLVKVNEKVEVTVKPEKIPVHLSGNIEIWLSAWLMPLPHSYFATTDEDGSFRIKNLPPGKWEFQVWHERKGNLATDAWHKGRFTLAIKPGENDLGTVKVTPEQLGISTDAK